MTQVILFFKSQSLFEVFAAGNNYLKCNETNIFILRFALCSAVGVALTGHTSPPHSSHGGAATAATLDHVGANGL